MCVCKYVCVCVCLSVFVCRFIYVGRGDVYSIFLFSSGHISLTLEGAKVFMS